MANHTDSPVKLYALLIGIDYYESNRLYSNLQGCVRDINLVDDYLRQTLDVPTEQIYRLTSPIPESVITTDGEESQIDALPTYKNIVDLFKIITEKAQVGEQVYIHYSGHGGHAKTVYPILKGENQYDEALVPMDIGDSEVGQYVRDVEMATLLKRMTDKGLIVTIILDSCHSGGATRGDTAIRSGIEPDTRLRTSESLVATKKELEQNWKNLVSIGTVGVAGLPEAREYVLIAACRPTEYAYEYAVNGSERNGALTYWMIDTLKTASGKLNYKTLYSRISAKVQSHFRDQLPMLLGEAERSVFETDMLPTQHTVAVIDFDPSQKILELNAGQAQGLSNRALFSIYPLNTTDFRAEQSQIAIAEVTKVEASRAFARLLDEAEGGIGLRGQVEQGSPAKLLSAPPDLVRRVLLFDQKPLGNAEHQLPTQELVNKQTDALEKVRQALTSNGWLIEVQEGEESSFQVAVGRDEEYEICLGMPILNLRPTLKINDPKAAQKVVSRLVHLAKYQAVQALDNPESDLMNDIELELLNKRLRPFRDPSNPCLKQGELVYMRIKNNSSTPLNIAVLDLEATWEVSQIPIQGMEAPFYQIQPNEEVSVKLRFAVPDTEEYEQVSETLKLFATRVPTDFRWLTLPPLDNDLVRERSTRRGISSSTTPLGKLLEEVTESRDEKSTLTRAIYEPDIEAEWVTKQIQISISR